VWLRNQMIRILPHLPLKERMTGSMQRAASAIALKDYSEAATQVIAST
jgi:hypothetical protein